MHRRAFLGAIGAIGSLAVIGRASREPVESVDVRFWRTDRVATDSIIAVRIESYLESALDLPFWSVEVTDGGVVDTSIEDGALVTKRGEWPARLLAGRARRRGIQPADDVNLLVTDGQMESAPTGYGVPGVASAGGGRYLAEVAPAEEQPAAVPFTRPNFAAQLLVHEVGHALGLGHEHGTAVRRGAAVVASPMLSSYLWTGDTPSDGGECGPELSDPDGAERMLAFDYGDCARRRLRRYADRGIR